MKNSLTGLLFCLALLAGPGLGTADTRANEAGVLDPEVLSGAPDTVVSTDRPRGEESGDGSGIRLDLLRFHLTSVFDSNIDHDLQDIDSYGMIAGVEARLVTQARPPHLWLAYDGGYQTFSNSSRWDRWQQSAELGTRVPVAGRLGLEAKINYDNRISTEDRELVNQFMVMPGLRYDGARWGLRGFGAWRIRRFTETPAYDEDIWMAGAEGRVRPGRRVTWRLNYGHEDAKSDTPSRSYTRDRLRFSHESRVGARNSVLLTAEHQWRTYPEELVEVAAAEVPREDRRWVLGAGWEYRFPSHQVLALEYRYEERTSNDPEEEYAAHRLELGVRWPILR